MSVNNYIRIGYPGSMTILTFDDRVPAEVERVKLEVLKFSTSAAVIGMWKKVTGLHYPIIGESTPSRSFGSYLS